MFPINLKWIDDIYDKIESACNQVDDIVCKEEESSTYVESLKNIGNNVKQFCSTMDPLKYVEDQLTNAGTTIEQLYASVVPTSVDTMLSAVNNIFPVIDLDPDSVPCNKLELKKYKEDNDDSRAEPATSVVRNEDVASTGKLENSKLELQVVITQTDQDFDEDSSPITDEFGIDKDPRAGFCSSCQIDEVEHNEETNDDGIITQIPDNVKLLDESCVMVDKNDWFTSQVPVDLESPKFKLPSPSTSKLQLIQCRQQLKTKSKSSISKEPSSMDKELAPSLSVNSSNHDNWESEWEII